MIVRNFSIFTKFFEFWGFFGIFWKSRFFAFSYWSRVSLWVVTYRRIKKGPFSSILWGSIHLFSFFVNFFEISDVSGRLILRWNIFLFFFIRKCFITYFLYTYLSVLCSTWWSPPSQFAGDRTHEWVCARLFFTKFSATTPPSKMLLPIFHRKIFLEFKNFRKSANFLISFWKNLGRMGSFFVFL